MGSPVVKSAGPTFGGDQTVPPNSSYIQTPSNNQSPPPLPSNNQSPPPLTANAPVSEEKTNNCGAGCAALFFYGIGGLVTLLSFNEGGPGAFIMGLILIGIGYGIQKASSTK